VRERTDGTHRAGETGAHTPGVHPHAGLPALAVPVEGSAGAFFYDRVPRRLLCIVHRRPPPIKWDMMDAEPADD
jgi:hypothetical protein